MSETCAFCKYMVSEKQEDRQSWYILEHNATQSIPLTMNAISVFYLQ